MFYFVFGVDTQLTRSALSVAGDHSKGPQSTEHHVSTFYAVFIYVTSGGIPE